jgi:hypothetical protein
LHIKQLKANCTYKLKFQLELHRCELGLSAQGQPELN